MIGLWQISLVQPKVCSLPMLSALVLGPARLCCTKAIPSCIGIPRFHSLLANLSRQRVKKQQASLTTKINSFDSL